MLIWIIEEFVLCVAEWCLNQMVLYLYKHKAHPIKSYACLDNQSIQCIMLVYV